MNNNIGFIIQARTSSTRFPNKVILPFYQNKNILEIIINKLKQNFNYPIVVATSTNPADLKIREIAENAGTQIFHGDENDVLNRFIEASETFKMDQIIRICADNPFLDISLLKEILSYTNEDFDYIAQSVFGIPSMKTHYGIWCEYIKVEALKKVEQLTNLSLYREHVTNYIYSNPSIFKIKLINADYIANKLNNIRLTVDTKSDFVAASYIFRQIFEMNPEFNFEDISMYFESHKIELEVIKKQMLFEINKNIK